MSRILINLEIWENILFYDELWSKISWTPRRLISSPAVLSSRCYLYLAIEYPSEVSLSSPFCRLEVVECSGGKDFISCQLVLVSVITDKFTAQQKKKNSQQTPVMKRSARIRGLEATVKCREHYIAPSLSINCTSSFDRYFRFVFLLAPLLPWTTCF